MLKINKVFYLTLLLIISNNVYSDGVNIGSSEKNCLKSLFPYSNAYDLEVSATNGDMHAQFVIGLRYYEDLDVLENLKKAFKWFKRAGDQGHPNAQYNLGVMYENGEGVTKNDTEASKWLKEALIQGFIFDPDTCLIRKYN